MDIRTYRLRIWIPIAGVGLALGGLYALWVDLDHVQSGIPWLIRNNKYTQATHVASPRELLTMGVFFVAVALLGVGLVVAYANCRVTLEGKVVDIRGLTGKVKFWAQYAEIQSMEERADFRGNQSFLLTAAGQRTFLINNFAGWDEMISELRGRIHAV